MNRNNLKFSLNEKVVILGGGISGLSRAIMELKQGNEIRVLEKDSIGGLATSFEMSGFHFDIGPHIFRSKNEKLMDFVKELVRDFNYVKSKPAVFKHNTLFDFVIPIIPRDNIEKLPTKVKEKAFKELEKYDNIEETGKNFEEFVSSQIGSTLYKEFFGDYSKKWWGIDPKKLSTDLAPKGLQIGEAASYGHITTSFTNLGNEIYPTHGGVKTIVTRLAERVNEAKRNVISENHKVVNINIKNEHITSVTILDDNDKEEEIVGDRFISTIPLTEICHLLDIRCDLKYRSTISVFISLKSDDMLLEHSWIYFHDPEVIFGRIHEPKYYSPILAPKGFTSLCVEVTCFENDETWNRKDIGEVVINQLLEKGIIKKKHEPQILDVKRTPNTYPIYTVGYKETLHQIFNNLDNIKLETIGRTGKFVYMNMDGCIGWALS